MSGVPAGLRRFVAPAPPASAGAEQPEAEQLGSMRAADAQQTLAALTGGRQQPAPIAADSEVCDMCSADIGSGHGHVADLERSALLCTCRACYLLFTRPEAGRGHYCAVPERYLMDPERPISSAEWDELDIPVGLAFFLRSSAREGIAGFYPSPAGVTECRLDLAAWQRITAAHPLLAEPEPDVEAALVHRGDEGVEHFLVPIDICYELAGRLRMLWRGFDGGADARRSIDEFLGTVRGRARPLSGGS